MSNKLFKPKQIQKFNIFLFLYFISFNANAYIAPLAGIAGTVIAVAGIAISFLFSFAYIIYHHCKKFIKKDKSDIKSKKDAKN